MFATSDGDGDDGDDGEMIVHVDEIGINMIIV